MIPNRLEFPREARLLKAADFRAVFRASTRAQAGPLRARVRPNGGKRGRLGLAMSRKACGNAVWRNRCRRQVRESFRVNQHRLAGLDVVVSLYPGNAAGKLIIRRHLPRLWSEVARAAKAEGKWRG